jgi:multidrug efflux pump subunit AcrA (membrane-fusion protein)
MSSLLAAGLLAMASLAAPPHLASSSLVVPRGTLEVSLSATGIIDCDGGSPLAGPSSPLPKQILALQPEGTFVRKGDVVAAFDPAPLEARIQELKTQLGEMKFSKNELAAIQRVRRLDGELRSDISREGADLALTERQRLAHESRLRILQGDAGVAAAKRRLDSSVNQLSLITLQGEKSLTEADCQAAAIFKEIDALALDVADFTLRAETDGLVILQAIPVNGSVRKPQAGDFLEPSQIFGRVSGSGEMVARLFLEESQFSLAKTGMELEVTRRSHPGKPLPASLETILPGPVTIQGRGNRPFYEAVARLSKSIGTDLKLGESVTAKIPLQILRDVYAVPRDYLDGDTLWIVRSGRVEAVQPTPAATTGDFVAFDSIPGLTEGGPLTIAMPPSLPARP